jgi:hypothetical protein
MNFQRLNEFLKKKKNWKIQAVTRGSIRLARTECVTDRWILLTGQRSTVNLDRTETGPLWAGSGLDTGWVGPVWAGPARTRVGSWLCHVVQMDFKRVAGPCAWLMVNRQAWSMGFERDPLWTASTLPSLLSAHGAPGAQSNHHSSLQLSRMVTRSPVAKRPSSCYYGSPMMF